jgi:hypothetical protein
VGCVPPLGPGAWLVSADGAAVVASGAAVHGSAIAWVLFMRRGSVVWQVSTPGFPEQPRFPTFAWFAHHSGAHYIAHEEPPENVLLPPQDQPIFHQVRPSGVALARVVLDAALGHT